MNINNTRTTPKSYFYTILYLDGYYPVQDTNNNSQEIQPIKTFKFNDTTGFTLINNVMVEDKNTNIYWEDEKTLYIRHNLNLPVTFEMWDSDNNPLFYCPILKYDISSMTIGGATIKAGGEDETRSIKIVFNDLKKPGNDFYKISFRSIPEFGLKNNVLELPTVDQKVQGQTGLAIVFRRPSLDSLFDLIAEFDNSYWHTFDKAFDGQYLTKISCYNNAFFETKYTNCLEDVIGSIDTKTYKIQFSWDNIPNNNPVYV